MYIAGCNDCYAKLGDSLEQRSKTAACLCCLQGITAANVLTFDEDVRDRPLSCFIKKGLLNVGALGVKIELYSLKCDVLISEQLFGSLAKGAVAFGKDDNVMTFDHLIDERARLQVFIFGVGCSIVLAVLVVWLLFLGRQGT